MRPLAVLSDHIIAEILSWLPVKYLIRFSCICKSWKSLITDPYFVKLHLHKSATNPNNAKHGLLMIKTGQLTTNPLCSLLQNTPSSSPSFVPRRFYFPLDGSCNGLLCSVSLSPVNCTNKLLLGYLVQLWNPATSLSSKALPILYVEKCSVPSNEFGFGYDPISDKYKVVGILFSKGVSLTCVAKVCCIGDNCWRKIQSPYQQGLLCSRSVYSKGTLNWIAFSNNIGYLFHRYCATFDKLLIVSLDLGKETWTSLSWPRGLSELPAPKPDLAVLNDCLCVCHDYKETHFVVWQMKEFGVDKSWIQLFKIPYEILQTRGSLLPLCLFENGDFVISSKDGLKFEVILYNQRDSGVQLFEIPHYSWVHPKLYVESLVSPF